MSPELERKILESDELKQLAAEETRGPESGESILHQKTWRAIWEIAQERGIALPDGDCTLAYLVRFLTTEVQRQTLEAAASWLVALGEYLLAAKLREEMLSPAQEVRNG